MMRGFHENRIYSIPFPLAAFIIDNMNYMPHWHTDIEIMYVLEGFIEIGVDDQKQILTKGEFAFVSSGQIHYVRTINCQPSKLITLIFHPSVIQSQVNWSIDISLNHVFLTDQTELKVKEDLLALVNDIRCKSPYYELRTKGVLFNLIGKLMMLDASSSEQFKNEDIKMMKKAITYIAINFQNNISLEDVAKVVNLNPQYFSRLFKKVTSQTFKNYLSLVRIEHFEKQVRETHCSLTKAALDSGFGSIRSFNRVFLKVRGIQPSVWQKTKVDAP